MLEITSQGPVNRHITEYLTTHRGVKQYKCKTLQNPDYYYTGKIFAPVDVAAQVLSDSNGSFNKPIHFRGKGIRSIGYKSTDDAYKFLGICPDDDQSGDTKLSISVESIEINGKPQTINLRDRLAVSPITTKFGDNLYVQNARQRTRIMIPGDSSTESFRVALRLHLKNGMEIKYRPDLDEYWIYKDGGFFVRFGKPYLVDSVTMNSLQDADGMPYPQLVKHSLTEISKGEYLYVKEPTEAFGKVILPTKFLIDADTVYSSTADGYVYHSNATWATVHDAATGSGYNSTGSDTSNGIAVFDGIYIIRSFCYYSLASLSGTVLSVLENIRGCSTINEAKVSTQKGTQAEVLAKAEYDSFAGVSYGNTASWAAAYNVITYNSTGISDVQDALSGVCKTCLREYDHDYLNVTNSGASFQNGLYHADYTGTTYDPYLLITMEAAAAYIPSIMRTHFIPSQLGGN